MNSEMTENRDDLENQCSKLHGVYNKVENYFFRHKQTRVFDLFCFRYESWFTKREIGVSSSDE